MPLPLPEIKPFSFEQPHNAIRTLTQTHNSSFFTITSPGDGGQKPALIVILSSANIERPFGSLLKKSKFNSQPLKGRLISKDLRYR